MPADGEALQGIDVADHPRQQVPAPERAELGRSERLDPLVDTRPQRADRAERQVVRGEPVEVPRQRPCEREEADDHDDRRERQDRRLLGSTGDEVPGRRGQRHAEAERERAEPERQHQTAARKVGEREQATEGRRHAASSAGSKTRPAATTTTRSATAASSGRCAISKHRPADAQPLDRLPHQLCARVVEVGGRLVEDHAGRVAEEGAGERDPPPLARRERATPVPDERRVSVREPGDEVVRASEPRRLPHAGVVGGGVAEADVVGDRAAEERRALRHVRDRSAPSGRIQPSEIVRPHEDPPRRRLREAQEERGERGLAAAARSDERDGLGRAQLEIDLAERVSVAGRIAKGDILEGDRHRGGVRRRAHPPDETGAPSARSSIREATAAPSALAWNCAARLRRGRYSSGASTSTVSAGLEPDIAFREADAHDDGDERDPECRSELEHRAGEKRGA